MKVIGVTGMPGSGKSVVSRVAEKLGMKVVKMGDVIREEAQQRNEDPGIVAVQLRKEYGKHVVASRCVDIIKNLTKENSSSNSKSRVNKPQLFLVEGIRSPWEVNIFKKNFKDFKVIAVHSKPETRFFRLKKRMRSDDSADSKESMERDQRELKFGIGEVIVNSDFMVVNEGSLNKFKKTVQRIIENEL
ncbi:MAG: dephospho-CoA kinase [Euryarchaeota archaeon]|uniref:AAA family ATPase n=1 Tax=Methanobacterium sp. MZD130B TaxID=3394378 RepID=UPI00175D91AD|nr:dephospho-CoA kinase [Euryarchaeota archaeon]HHT18589.1 AAA family ATPase [Methanobacterium sp.]